MSENNKPIHTILMALILSLAMINCLHKPDYNAPLFAAFLNVHVHKMIDVA